MSFDPERDFFAARLFETIDLELGTLRCNHGDDIAKQMGTGMEVEV